MLGADNVTEHQNSLGDLAITVPVLATTGAEDDEDDGAECVDAGRQEEDVLPLGAC